MIDENKTEADRPNDSDSKKETIKLFFKALKSNDVQAMSALQEDGFDLAQADIWSDTSLPEMALSHGAVEAAWWLMANGVMPTDWTRFSGAAGKSFLKKGFEMARAGRVDGLTLKTYAQIGGVVARKTGERLPEITDGLINTLDDFFGRAVDKAGPVVDKAVDKAVADLSPLVDKAAARAGKFLSGLGKQLEEFRARPVNDSGATGAENPEAGQTDGSSKPDNDDSGVAAAGKTKRQSAPKSGVKKETTKTTAPAGQKKKPKNT